MKFIEKLNQSKYVLLITCFILGVISTIGVQKIYSHFSLPKSELSQVNSEEEQAPDNDPFVQMRKQMLQHFAEANQGQSQSEFESREDDKNYYYDLKFQGLNQEKLKINIQNNQIEIAGEVEEKSANSFISSSFARSSPLPPNVDSAKIQIDNSNDKITIKLPKKS